jgi:hypothetical protein
MPLTVLNGTAYFALPMPLKDFPQLLRDHLNENPTTSQIESLGEELIKLNFPPAETTEFVKLVCGKWGGYHGIWGRVLKNNPITTICAALRTAVSTLAAGDIAAALTAVNGLNGLGDVFVRLKAPAISPAGHLCCARLNFAQCVAVCLRPKRLLWIL